MTRIEILERALRDIDDAMLQEERDLRRRQREFAHLRSRYARELADLQRNPPPAEGES